jgi:hypothetical protein
VEIILTTALALSLLALLNLVFLCERDLLRRAPGIRGVYTRGPSGLCLHIQARCIPGPCIVAESDNLSRESLVVQRIIAEDHTDHPAFYHSRQRTVARGKQPVSQQIGNPLNREASAGFFLSSYAGSAMLSRRSHSKGTWSATMTEITMEVFWKVPIENLSSHPSGSRLKKVFC